MFWVKQFLHASSTLLSSQRRIKSACSLSLFPIQRCWSQSSRKPPIIIIPYPAPSHTICQRISCVHSCTYANPCSLTRGHACACALTHSQTLLTTNFPLNPKENTKHTSNSISLRYMSIKILNVNQYEGNKIQMGMNVVENV